MYLNRITKILTIRIIMKKSLQLSFLVRETVLSFAYLVLEIWQYDVLC